MGFLNVTFDKFNEVQSWSGAPVVLDNNIPKGKYASISIP